MISCCLVAYDFSSVNYSVYANESTKWNPASTKEECRSVSCALGQTFYEGTGQAPHSTSVDVVIASLPFQPLSCSVASSS